MTSIRLSAASPNEGSRCYRLTSKGRACVAVVEAQVETVGSLSRYLHDILLMCGSGAWFDQLRQAMPPRSLEESLHALLALDLVECVESGGAARAAMPLHSPRGLSAFGRMAYA